MVAVNRAYRIATTLLYPAAALWTASVAWRARDMRYLRERLSGRCAASMATRRPVWIHCASVGELNAATPLIRAQLDATDARFVVTTNTQTAAAVFAAKHFPERVVHRYSPLDYAPSCRRFLSDVAPRAAWIMETELWLNSLNHCHRQRIPVSILNARLSEKTLAAARRPWGRAYYRQCLAHVARILARSEEDAQRFAALGAPEQRIRVAGNLKYAAQATTEHPRLVQHDYFLAASTHDGEEELVARAFLAARVQNRYLIIAPRHPHRGAQIERQLRQRYAQDKVRVLRRQLSATIEPTQRDVATIYIADTIGELPALIAHADFVFTGGSLVPVGGHNVLEAAALGAPQAVGEHTENITQEVADLLRVKGILVVASQDELTNIFARAAQGEYAEVAERARKLLRDHRAVLQTYADALRNDLSDARDNA